MNTQGIVYTKANPLSSNPKPLILGAILSPIFTYPKLDFFGKKGQSSFQFKNSCNNSICRFLLNDGKTTYCYDVGPNQKTVEIYVIPNKWYQVKSYLIDECGYRKKATYELGVNERMIKNDSPQSPTKNCKGGTCNYYMMDGWSRLVENVECVEIKKV